MSNKSDVMVKMKKDSSTKIYEERKKIIIQYLKNIEKPVSYYSVYKLFNIKGKAYFEVNHPDLKELIIQHNKKYEKNSTSKIDKDEIIRELNNKLKDYENMKKRNIALEQLVCDLQIENKTLNEAIQKILK